MKRRRKRGYGKYLPRLGVPFQRQSGDKSVKLIEFIFQREAAIRQAVLEKRVSGCGVKVGGPGTRHCVTPDPTAMRALRAVAEMDAVALPDGEIILWPERWLAVINAVREWCKRDEMNAQIFRHRYELREHYKQTVLGLKIEKSSYYQRLTAIRAEAKIYAILQGLIRTV